MAVLSQNGWHAYDSAPSATIPYITGRVKPGDVKVVLEYLAEQFDERVEAIRKDWSWGWAPRPVRGSTSSISNHASGTAVDFNAPAHVLGKRNTFRKSQVRNIEAILKELDGVVRWGGHYKNRADEMHFEIVGNAAEVRAVAKKIRNGTIKGTRPWRWDPTVKSDLPLVQLEFQKAAGHASGPRKRYHGNAAVQNALNEKWLKPRGKTPLKVDGWIGDNTIDAMRDYERSVIGKDRATTPDEVSLGPRGLQIMYRFK